MIQTIHEIEDRFDGYAKGLGDCTVYFLFSGSSTCNPQFMVRIHTSGDMRMVDQNDLKVYGNPQYGEPLVPQMPADWINTENK